MAPRSHRWLSTAFVLSLFGCSHQSSPVVGTQSTPDRPRASILTHHNDNARSGTNLLESELTPDLVAAHFGYLFSLPVDGSIYAQPLYVADLDLGDAAIHDVLYVATEHNSVYAFDANQAGPPLWQRSFGQSSNLVCFAQKLLTPEIGITSTPVIDRDRRTIYFVAFTQDDPASCAPENFHHTLYAVDLATGEPTLPPVEIAATTPIPFGTSDHLQRAALLLDNGRLYVAFASHADHDPYHGWLFAYDAATLALIDAYVDTPSGSEGGIWMAGEGPSADENGDVYVTTGNGTFDGVDNFSDSLIKLRLVNGRLRVVDSFTPYNEADLQKYDIDLGSTGVLLVPGTHRLDGRGRDLHLAVIGGKEGKLYLLDRDHLGGFHVGHDEVLQTARVTRSNIDGTPVWLDDGLRARLFVWGSDADLQALTLDTASSTGYLSLSDVSTVPHPALPGGFLSVTAGDTGRAIIWTNHPWSDGSSPSVPAIEHVVPGVLQAFDADNLSVPLWDNRADTSAPADAIGAFAKFCPPTIANGKVYFPAWGNKGESPGRVIVFGRRAQ